MSRYACEQCDDKDAPATRLAGRDGTFDACAKCLDVAARTLRPKLTGAGAPIAPSTFLSTRHRVVPMEVDPAEIVASIDADAMSVSIDGEDWPARWIWLRSGVGFLFAEEPP